MLDRFEPRVAPDVVQRQRLFSILDEQHQTPCILVTGQAAQGKTTLVASYLKKNQLPAAWIHMVSDNQEHGVLFHRIVKAVMHCIDSGARQDVQNLKTLTDLESAVPSSVLGTQEGLLRCKDALNKLFSELSQTVILVFDDLERLDENSSGFELLSWLITSRHDCLKLYLLSRQKPGFNLGPMIMNRSLFSLTNDILGFTLPETRDFFGSLSDLEARDIEQIHKITAGWAGGLILISESFRQINPVELPQQLTEDVFTYFSQEIYQLLPSAIKHFLQQTAVLEMIRVDILETLMDDVDVMPVLLELENRHLFIQRIDGHSGAAVFKYHHLFREFLIQDLLAEKGREYLDSLNRKIGLIFWELKEHESALHYFKIANAHDQIIRIIKIKGTDLVIRGNLPLLAQWISGLPEKSMEQDPWLIFFQTMTCRIHGGKKNIRRFQQALEMFEQGSDIRGILLCIGFIIEAAVFVRAPASIIAKWIRKGETCLKEIRDKERYPWARALLLQHIGLGYIAGSGNLPNGISACRNAIVMGQQINTPELVVNASIVLTFGYVQSGDFTAAGQVLSRLKQMRPGIQNPEYRSLNRIVSIHLALNRGEFKKAGVLLAASESEIDEFGLIFLYPGFIEAKALQLAYTGQYEDAVRMAEHLKDFSILEGNDFYEGISERIKAVSHYLNKGFSFARKAVQKALDALDPSVKGEIHYYQTRLLAGMIQLAQAEYTAAGELLSPLPDYFNQISSGLNGTQACLAYGIISYETGQAEKTENYLIKGIQKAREEEYLFFPFLDQETLVKALLLALSHASAHKDRSYILKLISRCTPERVNASVIRLVDQQPEQNRGAAIEHFRPCYKAMLPKLWIETLGQFRILLGDQAIDPKAFEGGKPVQLLKAIILHGTQEVPREILIDDLWPESNAKAGEKNFKINLHRLRKAIEPSPIQNFGYSYILQKAGTVSLDPDLVRIDVDAFLQAYRQGAVLEQERQIQAALSAYSQACGIYKGDYFANDPYIDSISHKRDLFRNRYLDILSRKAFLHEEADQSEQAIDTWYKALDADPCFEDAYQNLMILFADLGRKDKAVRLFDTCRMQLEKELGTAPDARTIDILKDIQNR